MLYTVILYENTRFTSGNVPDSPAILHSARSWSKQGHWDLQDEELTSLRLATTWNEIKNVDYIKFGNCYYFVKGKSMVNINMCILSLEMDALTTMGGVKNLEYYGGWIDRAHPNIQDEQEVVTTNEVIEPTHRLDMYKHEVDTTAARPSLIASTVALDEAMGSDGKPLHTETLQFNDLVDSPVLYIPKAPKLAPTCTFKKLAADTGAKIEGYGLYPVGLKNVQNNMSYIISLGLTGSLLYTYNPIVFSGYKQGHKGSNALSSITGGKRVGAINLQYADTHYKKSQLLHCKVAIVSNATGESRVFDSNEVALSGVFNYILQSDPQPDGKLYIRPKYYNGHITSVINQQAVASHSWIKQPIASNTSGLFIAEQNYAMQARGHLIDNEALNVQLGKMKIDTAIGLAKNALALPNQPIDVSLAGFAGEMLNGSLKAINHMVSEGYWDMEANKTRLEKAMAPVQIPNLSCTPSSGLAIYQDEIFTVYFIRPDNYDVERFEYYFDQYGYALNKKFDKSYLTSHSNFNYIQVNNIDIINSHSMLLREIGKKQLMNGVRIWHRLPNKNKSYE